MEKRSNENTSRDYLDYLKNKNDILEIYNLIRSKKYSKNQIRTQLRNYLNNPEDLNEFLHSILDSKTTKKEENTEGNAFTGALSNAKKHHKDEFKVGGKKFKVKESILYTESDLHDLIENLVIEEKNTFKKLKGVKCPVI